jgi:hypothetical protein
LVLEVDEGNSNGLIFYDKLGYKEIDLQVYDADFAFGFKGTFT